MLIAVSATKVDCKKKKEVLLTVKLDPVIVCKIKEAYFG